MSKQAVIAICVAVIIILGAGAAFLYSQTRKPQPAVTTTAVSPTPQSNNNMAGTTLAGLLTNGQTSRCTFSVASENGETNGTLFVSEDKARGDFTTTVNGKEASTHMIRSGNDFYMWGDSLNTGIKMVMNVNEMAENLNSNQEYAGIDPNQNIDFKCTSWTLDSRQFTPPTNIRFMSMDNLIPTGAMMQKTTGTPSVNPTGAAGNSQQCSICASLTGQARTTCLAQFNCQ